MAVAKRKGRVAVADPPTEQLADGSSWPMVPVGEIRPHPRNARQGDIGAICESIKANGFYRPIVVQRSTGYILAGNHAHRAAVQMGLPAVPVAWVDCDDETALRILLVDNRANDLASYDEAGLAKILQDVQQTVGSLDGTGFDGDALDAILADLNSAISFDAAPSSVQQNLEELESMRGRRREGNSDVISKSDTEKYLVIVFASRREREAAVSALGLPADERYIPAASVRITAKGMMRPVQAGNGRTVSAATARHSGAGG